VTRHTSRAYPRNTHLGLALLIGPTLGDGSATTIWSSAGDTTTLASLGQHADRAGCRPWGWWAFEAGERKPSGNGAQAVRLAELGELRYDELAALRERANEAKTRIGTVHGARAGRAAATSREEACREAPGSFRRPRSTWPLRTADTG
jgi:hypothetical protein